MRAFLYVTYQEFTLKNCTVENCSGFAVSKGLCAKHYQRFLRTGTTNLESTRSQNMGLQCAIRGCSEPARTKRMCTMHYKSTWRLAREEEMPIDEYIEKKVKLIKNPKPYVLTRATSSV